MEVNPVKEGAIAAAVILLALLMVPFAVVGTALEWLLRAVFWFLRHNGTSQAIIWLIDRSEVVGRKRRADLTASLRATTTLPSHMELWHLARFAHGVKEYAETLPTSCLVKQKLEEQLLVLARDCRRS